MAIKFLTLFIATFIFALTPQEIEQKIKEIEKLPLPQRIKEMNKLKLEIIKLNEINREKLLRSLIKQNITKDHHLHHHMHKPHKGK